MRNILISAAAAAMLAACTPSAPKAAEAPPAPAEPAPVVLPTEADISAFYDKIGAAYDSKDPAQVAALMTADAKVFSASANELLDTPEEIATDFAFYFAATRATPNVFDIDILDADTAIVNGVMTFDITRNGRAAWVAQRFTDVLQKQADGGWKLASSHTSNMPKPVAARLAPLAGAAAAPQPDTPPLGSATPQQ